MKETTNKKQRKYLLVLLFLLVSILASLVVYAAMNRSNDENKPLGIDTNINIGDIEGLSEEEIQDNLNAMVEYNKVNINMNTSITVHDKVIQNMNLKNDANRYEGYRYDTKDNKGLLAISCTTKDNSIKSCMTMSNKEVEVEKYEKVILEKSLQIKIVLDGEETPIYESGLVPYGSYLKTGTFNRDLKLGQYAATAQIFSYDEKNELLGQSNVRIDLYVVDNNGNY